MPSPFAGLRVVETAGVLAGPLVGQFFAELGAEVVKVEPPGHGDVTRGWRLAGEPPDEVSHYFSAINWGKASVGLDLRQPPAQQALTQLLNKADVWIDNWRPGQAERLGIDTDAVRADNPRLIHARLTAYGEDDPRPGYDAVLQAETGFMALNGTPGTGPLKFPVALVDIVAAHQLKAATLVALWQRERDGSGCRVSASLWDAGLSVWANQAAGWLFAGQAPRPSGSEHPSIVPYGTVFRAGDGGALVIAAGSDAQFERLCGVLGQPDWLGDKRFQDNASRVRHRHDLVAGIHAVVARRDRDAWLEALRAAGVPCSAIVDLADALSADRAAPLLLGSGERRGLRTAAFEGGHDPLELSPPPRLAADTDAVLERWLGWGPGQRDQQGIATGDD